MSEVVFILALGVVLWIAGNLLEPPRHEDHEL